MLYVLEDPSSRVAVLRLADRGPALDGGHRVLCLRHRADVQGVPLAQVRVIGTSSACDWDERDRPVTEEGPAALALVGRTATRGITPWMTKPEDWSERLLSARVGLFPSSYVCTLETVRDKGGYIARPRYPDDPPGAYDHVIAWTHVGPRGISAHAQLRGTRASIGTATRRSIKVA